MTSTPASVSESDDSSPTIVELPLLFLRDFLVHRLVQYFLFLPPLFDFFEELDQENLVCGFEEELDVTVVEVSLELEFNFLPDFGILIVLEE